jgi:molybdenum transport protein
MRISDTVLDALIAEDVPYLDLTSTVLGIDDVPASIEYYTREACLLCGTEEVVRIMAKLGLSVVTSKPSGAILAPGEAFLLAQGDAGAVHMAWKVCLNLLDHCSAIATKTAGMVEAVRAVDPHVEVLTTRKSMPGTKALAIKSVMCGGAMPHRLGLSETVLVFDHHIEIMGGFDAFLDRLPEVKRHVCEKKLFVETGPEHARALVEAGVDGLQFDKVSVVQLTDLVSDLRAIDPHVTLIAAGGINPQNAAVYAGTGVDGLATTALYTAKPLDMSVHIARR